MDEPLPERGGSYVEGSYFRCDDVAHVVPNEAFCCEVVRRLPLRTRTTMV